jgi:oligosaccharide reducing-end xylanase
VWLAAKVSHTCFLTCRDKRDIPYIPACRSKSGFLFNAGRNIFIDNSRNTQMKNIFVALILLSSNCIAQSVSSPYEVGTWQGFRIAAISYTFDDNCSNQLALAVPMFNTYGFQLTLFTVINWGPNWTGLQSAAAKGHEIASHIMSHTSLNTLSDSLQTIELKNSQAAINAAITGQKCMTIAYPNCNVGNTAIIRQYYFAARICSGVVERSTPTDFMNISSIICGALGSVKTSADFKSNADAAVSSRGWCVYLIHGIDNDGGYSPIPSDTIRASLVYLSSNPDKFWVSSFGNVAKYIRERNSVSVTETSNHGDSIIVQVKDTMDNSLYNISLTVRRLLPAGWTSANVMQNGEKISSQIVEVNSSQYVMFDVIPDNGDITILKSSAAGVESVGASSSPKSFQLYQNYPNPFNPSTEISYYVPNSQFVELKVFNVLGNEIATLERGMNNAGIHTVEFTGSNLANGVYIYRMFIGDQSLSRRMVFLK